MSPDSKSDQLEQAILGKLEMNHCSEEAEYGHGRFKNMLTSDQNLVRGLKKIAEKVGISWNSPSSLNAYISEPGPSESGSLNS